MTSVEEVTVAREKQPWGRPRVGVPTPVEEGKRRRSKQTTITLPTVLVDALDRERAGMVGMDRADLLRRIVAGELGRVGPGARWATAGFGRGRPAGGRSVGSVRVSVTWGPGQEELLEARAARLSGSEGVSVTVNQLVARMVARWLARRNQ